nr:hypothetical protein [Halomonas salinarum]
MTLDAVRPTQDGKQLFRDPGGILGAPDLGKKDHEFVSAMATDGIDVAHAVLETARNGLKEHVP